MEASTSVSQWYPRYRRLKATTSVPAAAAAKPSTDVVRLPVRVPRAASSR